MAGRRSETLMEALEEEILTGAFAPGARLEEVALAERFGVSRTPIREALHMLAAAGLVAYGPKRGATVAEIGPRRLMEMFDVIAELEAMAAGLAARRAAPDAIARIERALGDCARAADLGQVDHYFYENEDFHSAIRAAAQNDFLLEQITALHRRLRAFRRLQLRARNRLTTSLDEHGAIFAAIKTGRVDDAARAMRAHVAVQGERFADLMAHLDARSRAAAA